MPCDGDVTTTGVTDYQIESQRGWFLFGYPFFSANTLLPTDPRQYSRVDGYPLGSHIFNLEVPDNTWEWVWPRWYVDMSDDVDDQGWIYSWRFGSSHWHSNHLFARSFVRQRKWKRLRRKKPLPTVEPTAKPMSKSDPVQDLFARLEKCRNDRERQDTIVDYVATHPTEFDQLVENAHRIADTLVFPLSRTTLIQQLANGNDACKRFLESGVVAKTKSVT